MNGCLHSLPQYSSCDGETDTLYCPACGEFFETPCDSERELYDCCGNPAVHSETIAKESPLWPANTGIEYGQPLPEIEEGIDGTGEAVSEPEPETSSVPTD